MTPKNKHNQLEQEIRFKNRVIFILLLIIAFAFYKFSTYPHELSIHTAPDISKSFVQKVGDVPPTTVYGFARTIWESLHYCQQDCSTEFPEILKTYGSFLTKKCYAQLNDHFSARPDLFVSRARRLIPTENAVFDVNNVRQMSSDVWYVQLEYILDDDIGGVTTRRQLMQYPLKVTSSTVPTQYNPWGLEIDCYFAEPTVVEYEQLEAIQ